MKTKFKLAVFFYLLLVTVTVAAQCIRQHNVHVNISFD